jgi:hypothetical protein
MVNVSASGLRFAPGQYVRLPACPAWGLGQVQSADGNRVTVMFAEQGKVLIDTAHAELIYAEPEEG